MASSATAKTSIYDRMRDEWDVANGELTFEGEQYEPDGGKYVRLMVRHDESTQRSHGVRRFRRPGRILVQCFFPSGDDAGGVNGLDVLQDLVRAIFEGVSFDDINTYATTTRESGTDGGYIRGVAETRFDYDEIKT